LRSNPSLVDAPASGIRDLMVRSAAMEAARKEGEPRVIHMEVGQPDHATPQHILQATSDAVLADPTMTQYIANAGIERLRELVAERVTEQSPTVVTTPDNCLVTPGAVMSMATAFAVCLGPGSEVLVPDPGWPNYGLSASVLGATLVPYPCPANNDWLPDMAAMAAAVTPSTRMIVICNPSNPTGALIPEATLRAILQLAAAKGLYVLADEIYHDISYTDAPPASTLTIAAELGIIDHVPAPVKRL
jgi:aspartate aminotransferase